MTATAGPRAGGRVILRRLTRHDEGEFLRGAHRSAELHRPWIVVPGTGDEFRTYLARFDSDDREAMVACERTTGDMVGFVNLTEIVRGPYLRGVLSYAAFVPYLGRGLMTEGLALMMDHAFRDLGLHRLEADIQPGNEPSRRLVRGLGFRLEGLSPEFVHIGGVWRDHERWAINPPVGG